MGSRKRTIILASIISVIVIGSGIGLGIFFGIKKPTQLFLAIHCEPGSFPTTTDYPEHYWPNLVQMVFQADQNDVKLNFLFNPQWATYILQNLSRLSLVRVWESNGHELGLHVHGPNMGSWCGYTNQVEFQSNPKYLGSIADMMAIMNQLPASGQILTTCSSTDEDIIYDFPVGVSHRTFGGSDKMDHLWSKPTAESFFGESVTTVSHARYGPLQSSVNIDLEEFKQFHQNRNNEFVMGMVWHVFNFEDNALPYIQLFEYLSQQGIKTWQVSEL